LHGVDMDVFNALPAELREEILRSHASQPSSLPAASQRSAASLQRGGAASWQASGSGSAAFGRASSAQPKKRVRRGGTRKLEAFFSPRA
jgi:hypothetical protein